MDFIHLEHLLDLLVLESLIIHPIFQYPFLVILGSLSSGFSRMFPLLRWFVTFASNVRIFRNSSAIGPVFVTILG